MLNVTYRIHTLSFGVCLPLLWFQYERASGPKDIENALKEPLQARIPAVEVYPLRDREPDVTRLRCAQPTKMEHSRHNNSVPLRVLRDLGSHPVCRLENDVVRESAIV